jgi:hypothetical protein
MKRTLGLVLLAIAATACDGSGPSGSSGSEFEGRYTGTHRFSFGGVVADITCTGSVVIINVSGTAMTGTLTLDPCQGFDTTGGTIPISGTLAGSGSLSFTIPGQEQFVEDVSAAGCNVTRVDPAFSGAVVNQNLDAAFTATVVCPPEPAEIPFAWQVDMTKT